MIDFSQTIKDLNGNPVLDEKTPLTLGAVACNSLLATFKDEPNLQGADKTKRFALALKINGKAQVALKVEDVTLLKTLIGKAYAALVVGQAWEMLDPTPSPGEA